MACFKAAGGRHGLERRVCRGEDQDAREEADLRARNSTKALNFRQLGAIGNVRGRTWQTPTRYINVRI